MINTLKLDPHWGLSSKRHACMSDCIFDSSTWMSQRHLNCNVAKQMDHLPPEHLLFFQHILSLWVMALAVLLHRPQIYETSLMLSSPSPQCPIHHWVHLILSTEYLFNPSTSLHILGLQSVPAFLVSHLKGSSSLLASFILALSFIFQCLILFYFYFTFHIIQY